MRRDIPAGTVVGRYRIEQRIGSGAMGEVYAAMDDGLSRRVALKVLSETHRNNAELTARFLREARAVAKISHPHVVQIYSIEEFEGRPAFAMEFVRGKDLVAVVKRGGALPQDRAIRAIREAAQGLAEAARQGIIHRDVKPSNLMLTDSGQVKVTDFGLAKPLDGTDPKLTQAGIVVGTPDFIAPEQARGDTLDERCDIYALGCTLFYLLTARPPYRNPSEGDERYLKVVERHIRAPIPDPRGEAPYPVDEDVAAICRDMMTKRADGRPNYAVLLPALEAICARFPASAGRPSQPSIPGLKSLSASAPGYGQAASLDRSGRPGPSPSLLSEMALARPRRWPWFVTFASSAFFVTALVLYLAAPKDKKGGSVEEPQRGIEIDAGGLPAPATAPVTAPDGYVVVKSADGTPQFFAAKLPVTAAEFGRPGKKPNRAITGLSFAEAKAFAKKHGAHLLSRDEWTLAIETQGVEPSPDVTWEWVDDGQKGTLARIAEPGAGGDVAAPRSNDEIAFRLAISLPR